MEQNPDSKQEGQAPQGSQFVWTSVIASIGVLLASSILFISHLIVFELFLLIIMIPVLILVATLPVLQVKLSQILHHGLTPAHEWASVENSFRSTLVTIVGGSAILATIVFGWYNITLTRQSTTADRYAKAIENLSKYEKNSESQSEHNQSLLHIAGLYVIQEIANSNSPYREQSLGLIRNFLANLSPRFQNQFCKDLRIDGRNITNPSRKQTPGDDIQVAARILGDSFPDFDQPVIDLSQMDLCYIYLPKAKLIGMYGEGSDFRLSRIEDAKLQKAKLRGADFTSASLRDTDLSGGDFRCAIFTNANLDGALLHGSDFNCADLRGVNLSQSKDLSYAKLEGACVDQNTTILPSGMAIDKNWNCGWKAQDKYENNGEICSKKCAFVRGR